jgi:S-adenosyl-L-methionine hydrolase (adenosine-forming)
VSEKRKTTAPAPPKTTDSQPGGRIVTLLSDFGERDGFVGIVKGVLLGICPSVRIVDLSHGVVPQDVMGGALVLASAVRHFPLGTIHLAVVDPGVGTARRPILIETEAFVLVGPDNGLLSLAAERSAVRAVIHLDRREYFSSPMSDTFHARDVFAPVAAHCACGVPSAELGSRVDDFQRLPLPEPRRLDDAIEGQVIHVDRFGNLICNIVRDDVGGFLDRGVSISISGVQIPEISAHYSTVREGKPVAVWNSWGRLEVAIRNGSAARHLRARNGDRIQVKIRR